MLVKWAPEFCYYIAQFQVNIIYRGYHALKLRITLIEAFALKGLTAMYCYARSKSGQKTTNWSQNIVVKYTRKIESWVGISIALAITLYVENCSIIHVVSDGSPLSQMIDFVLWNLWWFPFKYAFDLRHDFRHVMCIEGITHTICISRWRHPMEIFFALLALCAGNSPVTGEFPSQNPATRSFDVFLDLRIE